MLIAEAFVTLFSNAVFSVCALHLPTVEEAASYMRSFKLRPFGLTASLVLIALTASGCFQTAGAALESTSTPQGGVVFSVTSTVPPATEALPTVIFAPTETPNLVQFPSETPVVGFPTETPAQIAFGVTNTPLPPQETHTPLPDQATYTPYPTYTPPPTYTPLPTAAPPIITPVPTKIALNPVQQIEATQTQIVIDQISTQIVENATATKSWELQQTQIAILQQTPGNPTPPPDGSGNPPPLPTGQFVPVYVTATPAGTPGIPGGHAAGYFDGTTCRYFVFPDDTLYSIAARLGMRVTRLAAANGIVNVELIRPGQYLKVPQPYCGQVGGVIPTQIIVIGGPGTPVPPGSIPPLGNGGKTYTVREGDTLFGIAARFRVSATALAQANSISNISLIYMGQVLIIP